MKKTIIILLAVLLNISTYAMEQSDHPKKSKVEKDPAMPIQNPKSLVDICLRTYSGAIKQSIDPKTPFKNADAIKQKIIAVKNLNNDALMQKLSTYLHENTQPIWRSIMQLGTDGDEDMGSLSEQMVFSNNTIAWGYNGSITYLNIKNSRLTHSYKLPDEFEACQCIGLTPNERYITTTNKCNLFLYDTQTGSHSVYSAPNFITAFTFSSDGIAFLGLYDGSCCCVKKDKANKLTLVDQISYFSQPIRIVKFGPDGSTLFISDGKTIALSHKTDNYKIITPLKIPKLKGHIEGSSIKNIVIAPDSSFLVINFYKFSSSLVYNFTHKRSMKLPERIITIDHINRCISANFTYKDGDENDDGGRACQLDYDMPTNWVKSGDYSNSTYLLPKDCVCSVVYQNNRTGSPKSAVIRQKDDEPAHLLVQKNVNLKELIYLIALDEASYEELQALKKLQQTKKGSQEKRPILKL